MTLFDIMGPVMVGPSSSHTAGAVRIGLITRALLGAPPIDATILLHGSFAATGRGHGTDRALVAGLLGMQPDDPRLPQSLVLAEERGLTVRFGNQAIRGAHPNTAVIQAMDAQGKRVEVEASSLGGGRIQVYALNGMEASFTGEYPTLIIQNEDLPGRVAEVASVLYRRSVNIATMKVYRNVRGEPELMVIESDVPVGQEMIDEIRACHGVLNVTYLELNQEGI
ncbi:MAG: L-serine ammonia-lyase, iron-sulfur-dependent, subunit beta [Oscillospiraceae bacterium]|nr:L-serine ammonia-lyase, iron-sulfur-dependent, subunit beta [Oscillospiraceae bacterium]